MIQACAVIKVILGEKLFPITLQKFSLSLQQSLEKKNNSVFLKGVTLVVFGACY